VTVTSDVQRVLSDLRNRVGAHRASVVPDAGHDPPIGPHGGVRAMPLGGSARLELEFGAMIHNDADVDIALEQAVRALRAIARDVGTALPAVSVVADATNRPQRIVERIKGYLEALANLHGAENALVVVRGAQVASARPVQALEQSRIELLVRRATANARAAGTTHAELADPDAFVVTFWHRAALIIYFSGPYATDFVRHRARLVARELTDLLPDLNPDPTTPAVALPPIE
jgi:hypothetical protein